MAQVTTTTVVEITPELAAQAFWQMTDKEMAAFFNQISTLCNLHEFNQQMAAVSAHPDLTLDGESVMIYMGRHSLSKT